MRVRISYSVDLEDVQKECCRMMTSAIEELCQIEKDIKNLVEHIQSNYMDSSRCKQYLSSYRQKLAKIDSVLADSDMILEGYYNAQERQDSDKELEDNNVADKG